MTRDGVVSERREGGVRVQNFTVRNESELDQCLETVADAAYKTVAAVKKLSPSTAAVAVGNKTVQLTGYNVNDNNYYKLRDIGDALGFAVDWDPEGVVVIRSADKTTDDSKNDTSDGNNGGNSSSDQNNSNNNTGNDGQTAETAASWTFSGAGWGHSVGMSQWGAYAMA